MKSYATTPGTPTPPEQIISAAATLLGMSVDALKEILANDGKKDTPDVLMDRRCAAN